MCIYMLHLSLTFFVVTLVIFLPSKSRQRRELLKCLMTLGNELVVADNKLIGHCNFWFVKNVWSLCIFSAEVVSLWMVESIRISDTY